MSGEEKHINFISNEGDSYAVPLNVAKMSDLVNTLIGDEDQLEDKDFNVLEVNSTILKKLIEYCRYYQEEEEMQPLEDIFMRGLDNTIANTIKPAWYAHFCENLDWDTLMKLTATGNYMGIKPLQDMACFAISLKAVGKSTDELREIFNLA